jgi:hypothetical protein
LPDKECFLQAMSLAKSAMFHREEVIHRLKSAATGLITPIIATY